MKNSLILPIILLGILLSSNIDAKERQKTVYSKQVVLKKQTITHNHKTIEGIASWYGYESVRGNRYHRPITANGDIFNPHKLTAAHKKLPFGTRVKVTNLKNNQSVVVIVNDRGPYVRHRIIDLSKHAAQSIGITGTEKVSLKILSDA